MGPNELNTSFLSVHYMYVTVHMYMYVCMLDLLVYFPAHRLELRCVIGIIRHGDRTPKQKMKMLVKHRKFFELFEELNGYRTGQLKIKKPKQLQARAFASRFED